VIHSVYYLLRDRLAGPGCWVGAEVRVYRDIRAVAARQYREPDLAVAWDRPDAQRVVYLLEEEGKAPDFVLEVLSDSTKDQDARAKKRWYQAIGVREYVIADPSGDYAGERRLQRWRLPGAEEADAAPPDVALEGEVLACALLPYGLLAREGWLRLVDTGIGEELPLLREELAQGRQEAELRRAAQAEAREELERRLTIEARLQAAEALARQAEARQREVEARAAAEGAARLAAEEELARLRRELQRRSGPDHTS
jgi:hypothetical protein